MLVKIDPESETAIVAQELKYMVENDLIPEKDRKAARRCLTYFLSYGEWSKLPKLYRRGVNWENE